MNRSSAPRAWTRMASASPSRAVRMLAPVPFGMALTVRPYCASKVGCSALSRPVSHVLVVVARTSSPSPIRPSPACVTSAPSVPVDAGEEPAQPARPSAAPPLTAWRNRRRCVVMDITTAGRA